MKSTQFSLKWKVKPDQMITTYLHEKPIPNSEFTKKVFVYNFHPNKKKVKIRNSGLFLLFVKANAVYNQIQQPIPNFVYNTDCFHENKQQQINNQDLFELVR